MSLILLFFFFEGLAMVYSVDKGREEEIEGERQREEEGRERRGPSHLLK